MKTSAVTFFAALSVSLAAEAATCPQPDEAQRQAGYWTVSGEFDSADDMVDFSGIDCATPDECLLVSDETRTVFSVHLDRATRSATLSKGAELDRRKNVDGGKRELDLEAVAVFGGDYVIAGSHGLRRKPKFAAEDTYQPSRFALYRLSKGKPVDVLTSVLLKHPLLDEFLRRPLGLNGINIEGLGSRDGKLFFGFRAPIWTEGELEDATVFDRALVLEVDAGIVDGEEAGPGTLHAIRLGEGEGIRAIEEVTDGLLLLTGPASPAPDDPIAIDRNRGEAGVYRAPAETGSRIVLWRPGESDTEELAVLHPLAGDKPEGLVVLDEAAGSVSLLVVHDSGPCGRPLQVDMAKP